MKITLANGTELAPIMVTGGRRNLQGANRDSLRFVFPADAGMETLDALFTPENCGSILVEDDTGAYIHNGYIIRAELTKTAVEIELESPDTPAATEERIIICMAQRTYAETQLASLTDTVDVLVMESLMI